ncbi:MAG: branched-chain amino acid ABC transporter permease, partial [Desulfobaccales bacterium]
MTMSAGSWPWAHILAAGFSLGSFYALVALGFSLIFGITRAFNLAHGELIVLAGYFAFALVSFCQAPFALTFPPVLLAMAILALPLCLLLRRLQEPYALNTLVVTFGLALLLQNLMLVWFSADYRLIRTDFANSIPAGAGPFSVNQIILIGLSLLATAAVHVLLHHTFLGKALRATIQDPEAAQIAGINVKRMAFTAFALGGVLIGLAGPLYGQNMYLYPTAGTGATLIAII